MKRLKSYWLSIMILLSLSLIYFIFSTSSSFKYILYNKFILASVLGYAVWGIISDLVTREVILAVWEKSRESYKKAKIKRDFVKSKFRDHFAWAPRIVGTIERILYTSAIVFNQYTLIGIWIALKIIGEWGDKRSDGRSSSSDIGRVRVNNYLIGSGISLIFGIVGGIIFKTTIDHRFLLNLLSK